MQQQAETFKTNAVQVIKDYGPKAMELLYKGSGPYKDGVPQSYPDISIENMHRMLKKNWIRYVQKWSELKYL